MSYSMLDDDPRGFRKKKSFASRLLRLHSLLAWLLVFVLVVLFWKTRTSLMKQVAELKDFSDSTQSETFEKISKMNENIGAKNREIAELSRAQRADKKTISQCEVEKSNLMSERDQLSTKYDGCTKETQSLKQQLESLRVEAEQNHQVHTDTHQMKDTRIQDLENQVKNLADQLNAQRNVNTQQQQQANRETQTVDSNNVRREPRRQNNNVEAGNSNNNVQQNSPVKRAENENSNSVQQEQQQQGIPSKRRGQRSPDEQSNGNIRITDLPDEQKDVGSGRENRPLPKPTRGRKKKSMGMLKEHMGIHVGDEEY
ncbi:hypothetical protein PSENEW3n2_00002335 [Picochlorum sp. SENEW3]|nr:hypothetical protein PSENEW3n2_00002335 [Picochlorum sp. SENEW3]WPT15973.1 hypothetical protein PSENEW3_00002335 [Picochlorum sp. SENEW3]